MSNRIGAGIPVRSWSGDQRDRPAAPLERGELRISGAVLDHGPSWHVTTDRLGWTTAALFADPLGEVDASSVEHALRLAAGSNADPVETARIVRTSLGATGAMAGLAVARFGPYGSIVELLNVSLPTVLHWDPIEGISPYEPLYETLGELDAGASTEVLRLGPGSVLSLTTCGILSREAGWPDLRRFVRALALDPLGGTLADAPPEELERLLRTSWGGRSGPSGMVLIGIPSLIREVA